MAYTQAYPLDPTVQDAFDLKVKLLEAREKGGLGAEEATYYFNARTPWIKLTSCVDLLPDEEPDKATGIQSKFGVSTKNELARRYVLGTTKPGTAFAGHNYDKAYGVEGNSYGIRPQPGITNMDIISYNKYGSLRKATINFQVWTKQDLDACELLYMRPGMSILLEWGWSLYAKGTGTAEDPFRIKDMGAGIDVLTPKVHTLHEALDAIQEKQKQYNYGYDGILGFVKNFNWTIRPDGGYDCSTELVTAGELIESFNMAKPLSDSDAGIYDIILGQITAKLKGEKARTGIKYLGRPAFGSASYRVDEAGKTYQHLMSTLEGIPSPSTQTVLSGFIKFDLRLIADSLFEGQLSTEEKNIPTVQAIGISAISNDRAARYKDENGKEYAAPISTRIFQERGYEAKSDDVLRVNWIDPNYAANESGTVELTEDSQDFKVVAERNPQMYIRYGLILNILNNFMLQQGVNAVAPFDIKSESPFNVIPNLTVSIDPSVCLLPAEELALRQVAEGRSDTQVVESASTNIYDIRVNISLLEDLLESSGIAKVGAEGTPTIKVFDMIKTLNTKINESTGNLLHLDIQYYDHLGYFAIVDRKTFYSGKKYYRLDIFGLKSLMHSINVNSALTTDMSSAIAISAQTKISNADSHSAGFLRFNDGIQDRVITDRSLDGPVVKDTDTEYANTTSKEDYSEIFQLYEIIYSKIIWAEANFPYAKNKFVEFVKQLTGNTDDGFVGQVVIPFTSTLVIDGMAGFRIMNGFTLDPKVLPYKYDIKGGAGQVITGLQTTVDSTTWKTSLKSKFYNLEAGTPPENVFPTAGYEEDGDIRDSYVYQFAKELSNLGYEYYSPYTSTFLSADILERFFASIGVNIGKTPTQIIEGNYNEYRIEDMQWMIDSHYENFWGNGTVKEATDAEKSVGDSTFAIQNLPFRAGKNDRGPSPDVTSALQMYWVNYKEGFSSTEIWQNHKKYPWSAVYVSFMMGKVDLRPKLAKTTAGTLAETLPSYQGYGSPQWVKAEGHYGYAYAARIARKFKAKDGRWVAFALKDLRDEDDVLLPNLTEPSVPYQVPIRAQAGDILIKPRNGGYYKSHGAIVAFIGEERRMTASASRQQLLDQAEAGEISDEDLQLLLAGQDGVKPEYKGEMAIAHGNMSNTNKLERVDNFIDPNNYYYPDNPQGYLLVLKRFD